MAWSRTHSLTLWGRRLAAPHFAIVTSARTGTAPWPQIASLRNLEGVRVAHRIMKRLPGAAASWILSSTGRRFDRRSVSRSQSSARCRPAEPLGRVTSVTGSQAGIGLLGAHQNLDEMRATVGKFVGIRRRQSRLSARSIQFLHGVCWSHRSGTDKNRIPVSLRSGRGGSRDS